MARAEPMDTGNSVVEAGRAVGAGWRGTQRGPWGTSVLVSTMQEQRKEKEAAFLQCLLFLKKSFFIF